MLSKHSTNCQKAIPENIKRETEMHAHDFRTASVIKKVTAKYNKDSFNRATVKSWKNK